MGGDSSLFRRLLISTVAVALIGLLACPLPPTGTLSHPLSGPTSPRTASDFQRGPSNPQFTCAAPCVVATVPVGEAPTVFAYDPAARELFVVNIDSDNLSVISTVTDSEVASVPLVFSGVYYGLTVDPAQREVFVTRNADIDVVSDESNAVVASIPMGGVRTSLAYDSGTGQVFAAAGSGVDVISALTDKVVTTIPITFTPRDDGPLRPGLTSPNVNATSVVYDSGRGEVFVANGSSNNVSVINDSTDKVVAMVDVGGGPFTMAYDNGSGDIDLVRSPSQGVSVISDATNTVVATYDFDITDYGVAYDSRTGVTFSTHCNSNNITLYSDARRAILESMPEGYCPSGLAYDPQDGLVWVANYNSGNVSAISDGSPSFSLPTIKSLIADPPSVSLDSETNLVISAQGREGLLSYAYAGLPGGCTSQNTPTLTCRPQAAGTFLIRAYANDSYGDSADATTTLTVASTTVGCCALPAAKFLGLPLVDAVGLFAVLAVMIVATLVVVLRRRRKVDEATPPQSAKAEPARAGFCTQCGRAFEDTSPFCPGCGTKRS